METTDDVGGACTWLYEDPFQSGNKVPCCAGLDMELDEWDGDGKNYYKCLDKDAWKPIPKKELKCFGSDYVKCLDGGAYIRPSDGVWVLDDLINPRGPSDPECTNGPHSSEQLCNECAGGCIDGDCSTDGQNFCKPPQN